MSQIFAVSLECAVPFIDNFRIIHNGADQRFPKKVLVILDARAELSHQDTMAILRHETVINGSLSLKIIHAMKIYCVHIWLYFAHRIALDPSFTTEH